MFREGTYVGEGGQGGLEFPSNFQMFIDYVARTDGQPIYVGFAPKGAATSDNVWLIQKSTYNGSNQLTQRQSAVGSYDNRASLTYS